MSILETIEAFDVIRNANKVACVSNEIHSRSNDFLHLFNHTFYETNFKPKLFTAKVECNGTVLKEPKTEKAILFLNLNSRSIMATSCFGSLSTLLYTSDLKWH